MEIKIVAKNGTIPEDVQQLIENKVSKLPRLFERTTAIYVIANLQHTDKPEVEVRISAEERDDFFASDTGTNVLGALESAIGKIESQMRRHKSKTQDHHRGREVREDLA
ncbi:MAG: ribosome-associated translation inhibitor RaiA [Pirellulaceae bacterium]